MMCQDVMKSAVKCIAPTTTIEDAAVMMRDEGIGFLPVCDAAKHVLGAITDRDITTRAVASHEAFGQPIEKFMTKNVVACRPSDDLAHAQELMGDEKVSRIMCVNDDGVLEGIISLSDIAQIEDGDRASATLRNVSDREVRI